MKVLFFQQEDRRLALKYAGEFETCIYHVR